MKDNSNAVVFAPGTVVCEGGFNPLADIQPVDQFGFVNLLDAYVNGTIPGDLSVSLI